MSLDSTYAYGDTSDDYITNSEAVGKEEIQSRDNYNITIFDLKNNAPIESNIYLDISKKRNFKDLYDKISEAVYYFNYYDPYFYDRVKYALQFISDPQYDIAAIIYYILDSPQVIANYRAYVDSVYDQNIESNRCNPELQFTNEHAKIILVWSRLCLVAAPFIAECLKSRSNNDLADENKINIFESKFLINKVFVKILNLAHSESVTTNILEKIRKMVSSRVYQTKYSDKMMWACLYNMDIDPELTSENIRRQIIIEGVMKLDCPSNVVKYLHSLIKNQIKYLFRGNFELDMHPVRSEAIRDDSFSGTEHLETELSRRDEGSAIILDLILKDYIARLYNQKPFTQETYNIWWYNFSNYGISNLQLSILTRFLHSKVGNIECIKSMTFGEIITALILIRSWMYDLGLSILPELISSVATIPPEPKKITSRRKFLKDFTTSSSFKNLLSKHFQYTLNQVAKSKIIVNDISQIYASNFTRIAEPGLLTTNQNLSYEDYFLYDYNLMQLAQELLVFNEQIILADRYI